MYTKVFGMKEQSLVLSSPPACIPVPFPPPSPIQRSRTVFLSVKGRWLPMSLYSLPVPMASYYTVSTVSSTLITSTTSNSSFLSKGGR